MAGWWTQCPSCGELGISWYRRAYGLECRCKACKRTFRRVWYLRHFASLMGDMVIPMVLPFSILAYLPKAWGYLVFAVPFVYYYFAKWVLTWPLYEDRRAENQ